MNRRLIRTVLAVIASTVTSQALAWEVVTEHVDTEWYTFKAEYLWYNQHTLRHNSGFDDYRPTSIDIVYDQDTYNYQGKTYVTAPCVLNTGAHHKSWYFMYDETPQHIADYANAHGYTVVDFEEYKKGGGLKYAALMEKFSTFKSYFMYAGTNTPWLSGFVNDNGGKVVDMDVDDFGNTSLHGAVNFGVPTYGVTWDSTMTWSQLGTYLSTHNKRLQDLQHYSGGYCALFCDLKPGEAGLTSRFGYATMDWIHGVEQQGWRVETTNSEFTENHGKRYSGVLVWNG